MELKCDVGSPSERVDCGYPGMNSITQHFLPISMHCIQDLVGSEHLNHIPMISEHFNIIFSSRTSWVQLAAEKWGSGRHRHSSVTVTRVRNLK